MHDYDPEDRFEPVGRWVRFVWSGRAAGPKRFIYDADVERVAAQLATCYPEVRGGGEGLRTAIRALIYQHGPEHPNLTELVAFDLGFKTGARA